MRTNRFIKGLVAKGKVKLVTPSAAVAQAYHKKSLNALAAAKLLARNKLFEEAISMAYYAMYHEVLSLLFLVGIKSGNHAATILLLTGLFGIDGTRITNAKRERVEKQYEPDPLVTREDVATLITDTEVFVADLDAFTDRLTEEERLRLNNTFRKAYCVHSPKPI